MSWDLTRPETGLASPPLSKVTPGLSQKSDPVGFSGIGREPPQASLTPHKARWGTEAECVILLGVFCSWGGGRDARNVSSDVLED